VTSDDLAFTAWMERIRQRTPARLLLGRSGAAYPTQDLLDLRRAHAAAKDAVLAECNFGKLSPDLVTVSTRVRTKEEYLLRPDLGRSLSDSARTTLGQSCRRGAQLQIVVGDGLSATAVDVQVPSLLPLLISGAEARGWSLGVTFAVRYCRVGVMNDIGDLLDPQVLVLLIGERPGLATAESLSAYMAYRPRTGHTDADRNLISNIHARGTQAPQAAERILDLAAQMMARGLSGATLKEEPPAIVAPKTQS
jgi:ethanolamine ammonia-lyase small subunit